MRQEVCNIAQDESVDGGDMVDDDGFQDDSEAWEVTHVREEDLETTEGEGVDFQLNSWSWWDGHRSTTRRRRRTCLDYGFDDGLKYCFQHGVSFQ